MVSHKASDNIEHATFLEIQRFLSPGDLIIVNDSATLPAALTALREDGTEIAFHLSTNVGGALWVVEPRKTKASAGEHFRLPGGGSALLLEPHHGSSRLWLARLNLSAHVHGYLARWGRPIKYDYVLDDWPIDTYQTVYARRPGSAEMPSAGRAFSRRVIAALRQKGVRMAAITLHTGVSSLEEHEPPYEEWFDVSPRTAAAIRRTRRYGGRIIAVGTTVVRALETASAASGFLRPASGWTSLIITPDRPVNSVDALLTGFHEPLATHLAMLEAIAGPDHVKLAYEAALEGGYLWHEFGDLHLMI
jgi:S-adenosylmethionine:tRNA ribosyltransferase-isomerase